MLPTTRSGAHAPTGATAHWRVDAHPPRFDYAHMVAHLVRRTGLNPDDVEAELWILKLVGQLELIDEGNRRFIVPCLPSGGGCA